MAYPMITRIPLVAGNLPIKKLWLLWQWPIRVDHREIVLAVCIWQVGGLLDHVIRGVYWEDRGRG